MERYGPVAPDKREVLLRQLESHAAVLEAQSAVVKTVVKLVGPAVVLIAAGVTEQSVPLQGGRSFREEAGSGVVVRIGDRDYVLTNRHVIDGATPQQINITLADGRPLQPTQVWTDVETRRRRDGRRRAGSGGGRAGEDTPLKSAISSWPWGARSA